MGKFVMRTNDKGVRFVLRAGNGQVIGVSETYSSETACQNGIESVRKNAVAAGLEDQTQEGSSCKNPKFEVYKDKAGEFRFRLKAANGEIILTGEGYKAKAGCLKGIDSIRRNAPDAAVIAE
ncbi:MAG: YegP family protein [Clostridia bacterium]|nr:YegP family protein [Clostridia bacterium]